MTVRRQYVRRPGGLANVASGRTEGNHCSPECKPEIVYSKARKVGWARPYRACGLYEDFGFCPKNCGIPLRVVSKRKTCLTLISKDHCV